MNKWGPCAERRDDENVNAPPHYSVRPLSCERYDQPESPRVDPRTDELFWVDMRAGSLNVGKLIDGETLSVRTLQVGGTLGAAAPLARPGEGWIAGWNRDLVHIATDGYVRVLIKNLTPGPDFTLNDGICAPDGSFWIGSQTEPRRPEGTLYRIGSDLSVNEVLHDVTVSNGITFDGPGSTLYYVDTLPHRALEAFDVTPSGLTGRRVVHRFTDGNPDGIALDEEGHIWVAVWDAGKVYRIDLAGRISAIVDVPVRRPTAVALWQGMLVITTAMTADEPLSGHLFAADVGMGSRASSPFNGSVAREGERK